MIQLDCFLPEDKTLINRQRRKGKVTPEMKPIGNRLFSDSFVAMVATFTKVLQLHFSQSNTSGTHTGTVF
jgi:hypothetical protein